MGALGPKGLVAFLLIAAAAGARGAAPPEFTPLEKRWIAEHPVVAYGSNPNAVPYSFEELGVHRGMDADLMALLGARTGIRFAHRPGLAWPEVFARARRGEIPVVATLAETPGRADDFIFTEPVMELRFGIFTRVRAPYVETLADLAGLRVALPRDTFIDERIAREHPAIVRVPVGRVTEGAMMVSLGEVDALVASLGGASHAVRERGVSNLRMQATLPELQRFAIGVHRNEPVLHAILDKALAGITPAEMRAIRERWIEIPGPGYTRDEVLRIAAIAAAIAFMFAAVIVTFLYRRLRWQYKRLEEAEGQLKRQATIDDLSGLGNRRAYTATLEVELARASRQSTALTLVEIDIDHFKAVNDRFGHEVGDEAIHEIADTIRSELRLNDQAFRIGGEEFVVLLPDTDAESAPLVAERIRRSIAEIATLPAKVTASLGVAVLPAGAPGDADRLFSLADAALYRAKADGRNCVRFAPQSAAVPAGSP